MLTQYLREYWSNTLAVNARVNSKCTYLNSSPNFVDIDIIKQYCTILTLMSKNTVIQKFGYVESIYKRQTLQSRSILNTNPWYSEIWIYVLKLGLSGYHQFARKVIHS